MKKLIAIFAIVMSSSALAEPSGSLRTMMDTKISLIEYYTLMTKISNVERLVADRKVYWGYKPGHKGVVQINPYFDYEGSKLIHTVTTPGYYAKFDTISEAKTYCKQLIEAAQPTVHLSLFSLTPNGWGTSKTNAQGFEDNVRVNSTMKTRVTQNLIAENLPSGETYLSCTASDIEHFGEISGWSFNI